MKATITILLTGLFIVSLAGAAGAMDERRHKSCDTRYYLSNTSTDFDDDGTLCIRCDGRRHERIEITADYKLYINGRRIKTDDEADELLEEYYEHMQQLVADAAKIGLRGGELGVTAVSGVIRAFLTDYEFDDLERDLEDEAEKLETLAEGLEEEAAGIEELAEELDDLADE